MLIFCGWPGSGRLQGIKGQTPAFLRLCKMQKKQNGTL